ncbi:Z protein [Mammarenavirus okahandjaense]|uniref:RING finger protein Z n=1 Tax=Mammarenavirus okahandjaense TaxID=3052321 RepID=A0A0H3W0W4_9VIRU|nr:Z protein [Mammarenavirus okahandjaense]AKH39839.1 Z protein [Mammarenavirus okahandjaense]
MGTKWSKETTPPPSNPGSKGTNRATLYPDASNMGPVFCKSCWFENKGLVNCSNHYLCLSCLTLLLTVSDRCPICKHPLPTKITVSNLPTCPSE